MTENQKIETIVKLSKEVVNTYPLNYFRSWDIKSTRTPFQLTIEKILKELYSGNLNDNGKIVNLPQEESEYSFLNYVNTNYSAFAAIINWINGMIVKQAKKGVLVASKQLDFKEDRSNWSEEMKLAIMFINKYKHDIFLPTTDSFKIMLRIVSKTMKRGYESEEKIQKFIKIKYPEAIDFKTGGHGEISDMVKGIDLTFTLKGRVITVQNKKCKEVNKRKYYYFIDGVAGIKDYKVDCLSFEDNRGNLFLFKNKDIKVHDSEKKGKSYMIPIQNLVSNS